MRNSLIAFTALIIIALIAWGQQPVSISGTPTVSANQGTAGSANWLFKIMDAAGNARGANVNASNQLSVSVDNTPNVNVQTNAAVNVAQMNGVTTSMNAGAADTGTQRVAIANTDPCGPGNAKSYAFYDASTNGATQLVALASSKIIYVCSYSFSSSSTTANTLKLVYGTGSNCATGQNAMTPGIVLQAATSTGPIGKVNPNSAGLATIASNALCVLTNAAAAAQAEVSYVQQ